MAQAKVALTFQVFHGDTFVRTATLAQDIIKIGKLPSSHLKLDDDSVSRMHAVIEVTGPDEIYLIDLGSASGTFVNGKRINKTKLSDGDEIVVGNVRLVMELGDPAETEPSDSTLVSAPSIPAVPSSPPAPPSGPPAAPPMARPAAPPAQPTSSVAALLESAPVSVEASHSAPPVDPDRVQYSIVASGPPVSPEEVETAAQAVEVVIMWGENSVLHVAHLSPPRSFYIGEDTGQGKDKAGVDYLVGSELIGTDKLPIVSASAGSVAVVIPNGASGEVAVGDQRMTISDLVAAGRVQPSPELAGASQYPLPHGATAKIRFKGLTFLVKSVHAGRPVGIGGPQFDYKSQLWTGVSLLLHLALLLMMYFMPPSPSSLSLDLLNADSRLVKYLIEPPETEEEKPEWMNSNQNEKEGGTGKRHKGDEGQMGKQDAKKSRNRFGIEGPADNQNPQMAREAARQKAKTAGILGVLGGMSGSWNSPTSPFGADVARGNDPMSALGALMGDQIGENFGFGGLGMRGTGRGGGGTGEGTIGAGNLGTIGHGAGGGTGSGYGRGAGHLSGRTASVPQIRQGEADVHGSLSKEVIRRVIRRHINEVRFCYEQELAQRPDLSGRVTVKFIISPDGAVQSATVGTSSLNNNQVESCIAQAVRRWTFPAPEGGGIVVVNYPFVLEAAGGE